MIFFSKQKREANERSKCIDQHRNVSLSHHWCFLDRRETMDKSQRTDGESTATGSSTPGAGSNSSMSSIGQEVTSNNDHSLSAPHHLVVCPNTSISTSSCHSNSPGSDSLSAIQPVSSPGYPQQPLALTMHNSRNNNDNNTSTATNANLYPRKETFPINHLRQSAASAQGSSSTSNNTSGSYLKA